MQALPEALAAMAQYPQFLLYKLVRRGVGKTDKLPIDHRTLRTYEKGADWQADPAAVTTFDNAVALAGVCGPDYGVGFLFTERDPFFFLDLDHCLVNGAWSAQAVDIMARLPGAAVEVSQSGEGLHLFGMYTAPLPPRTIEDINLGGLYTEKRFAAMTGTSIQGNSGIDFTTQLASIIETYFPPRTTGPTTPTEWTTEPVAEYTGPEDDDELIRRACSVVTAAGAFGSGSCPFAALWNNDETTLAEHYPENGTQQREYDASRADASLAQHLAFWTGKNCDRMLRLMWKSGLVRDKWEHHESYLERTIEGAVALQGPVYSVKPSESAEPPPGAPKLKGTPKQVEWAEQLRTPLLNSCTPELFAELTVSHGMAVEAKFWIDNRGATAEELAEMVRPVQSASLSYVVKPEFTAGYQFLGGEQQVEYFSGCVYVQEIHKIFIPSGSLLGKEQFNAMYGGFVFQLDDSGRKTTKKAWEAFTESQLIRYPKVETTCFKPEIEPGSIIRKDGRLAVNTYVPVETERKQGDASPFFKHLSILLPDQNDQAIVLAYMAACVQHKGVKFQWAPLIQGAEGNGKTLFTRCLAWAIGEKYTHMPPAEHIGEKFNEWMFGKLLIGVEDIYVPEQKRELIETLKPMITNERQPCRAMQSAQEMQDCCANFMFNTNHRDAMRKTQNDRRYSTLFCAQQEASDIERDGMGGNYFPNLYNWLRAEGYAIVNEMLHTYAIPDELNPAKGSHRAPRTSTTDQAIHESLGSVEQEILEAIDEGRPGFAGGWVSSTALETLLKNMRRDTSIPHNKRRDLLRSLGYDWHPSLNAGRVNNPVMPDGKRSRLFVKRGHLNCNLTTAKAVVEAYTKAQTDAVNISDGGAAAAAFGQ